MKNIFLPFILLLTFVFSCRENDNEEVLEKKNQSYDVYVAGKENNKACYWKNNIINYLNNGDNIDPMEIKVENNNIYVTGLANPTTTNYGIEYFWKNNVRTVVKQYLNIPNNVEYKINSFTVSNGDIYFAGYVENPIPTSPLNKYELCYWKNGTKTILYQGQYISPEQKIFVNGSDVYVSTKKVDNNQNYEVGYFKNLAYNTIPDAYLFSYNFAKNNAGVHLLFQKNSKYYSKNLDTNVETLIGTNLLPIPSMGKIISHNINNDLYMIEHENGTSCYKNSTLITTPFTTLQYFQDLFILDNNMYMIKYYTSLGNYNAKVFINGVESQNISSTAPNTYYPSTFNSIYVVPN